ncbi:MAG: retropepsin-like domain-containing protein [Candidatus Aminicenantes bacterium]|nr:MAG: retropepsin-like domain-containing protein [Candidatus Aminicenantes bacterium]
MNLYRKHLVTFFVLLLFVATSVIITASDEEKTKYRSEVLKELVKVEAAFNQSTDDKELRKEYATLLFQTGDFWKAKETLNPLLRKSKDVEILILGARLSYMMADYKGAEKLYSRVMSLVEEGSKEYNSVVKGLALTYFQTHQYAKVKGMPEIDDFRSHIDLMKKFPGKPYEIEWGNKEKISSLPFEIKGMLPSMKVVVNGKELEFILDTGGNLFYIDKIVAEECGLEKLVSKKAKYAYTGGEEVDEFLGRADSVKLGEVTLKNVPFTLAEWKSRGIQSDGVVTTQALKEFLATVDYANKQMVFRKRSKSGMKKFKASIKGKETVEMPFVMDSSHFMFVRGSLNGTGGLSYLVDSGLAASMPFVGMDGLIEDMGLELKKIEGTKYSWFKIGSLGMGDLILNKPTQGLAGVVIEKNPYWRQGFIWDGLISHQFLKNFSSWTIDFDSMTYIFEK